MAGWLRVGGGWNSDRGKSRQSGRRPAADTIRMIKKRMSKFCCITGISSQYKIVFLPIDVIKIYETSVMLRQFGTVNCQLSLMRNNLKYLLHFYTFYGLNIQPVKPS